MEHIQAKAPLMDKPSPIRRDDPKKGKPEKVNKVGVLFLQTAFEVLLNIEHELLMKPNSIVPLMSKLVISAVQVLHFQ